MYSIRSFIYLVLAISFLFSFSIVKAHSGRTDSSGGHNCNVGSCAGTYHYHNGGPAYNPPAKTSNYIAPVCNKPILSTVSGSPQINEINCKQNVTFSWDKGIGDEKYSIALSKTAGADPGPIADTNLRSKTFTDIKPGKWYINLKGGNSCGWSQVIYWEIDVPEPNVVINNFSLNNRVDGISELRFSTKCGETYSITPGYEILSQTQIDQGYVEVKSSEKTEYTLTVSGHGQKRIKRVTQSVPTPSPIQEVKTNITPTPASSTLESNNVSWMSAITNKAVTAIFKIFN